MVNSREAQTRDRGPLCSASSTDGDTEARDGQQPHKSPGKQPPPDSGSLSPTVCQALAGTGTQPRSRLLQGLLWAQRKGITEERS